MPKNLFVGVLKLILTRSNIGNYMVNAVDFFTYPRISSCCLLIICALRYFFPNAFRRVLF
jgi:hypothetical protein